MSNDETTNRARRLFIFLSFLMTLFNFISAAGTVRWFYYRYILGIDFEFDEVTGIIFLIIFLGYLIGLIGIFKPQPPLHYGILIASLINLVISLILIFVGNQTGLLQGMLSFLILYLGLRFPLEFADGQLTYDRERILR